jgi:hypothetical protein
MANQHDHSSNEQKPVSFTVPFILGAVTIIIILLLVSLGDPCHEKCECDKDCSKECLEACEKGDHSKHPDLMKETHEGTEAMHEISVDHTLPVIDSINAIRATPTATKVPSH